MSADIEKFFTRIPKSVVISIIAKIVDDDEFIPLLRDAVTVELSNMAILKEKAGEFPLYDIGVAQGNSLSPLLGNILLFEFDQKMNEGDCRCIRYIDDIIILAPSKRAAIARMKLAKKLISQFDMSFGLAKTQTEPSSVSEQFEFLGIELNNGMIRPSEKSRARLITSLNVNFSESQKSFREYRAGKTIKKEQSLLSTLRRLDGILIGWGKHYRFCNDTSLLEKLDRRISEMIRRYIGEYGSVLEKAPDGQRRVLLGVELLYLMKQQPLQWPKAKIRSKQIDTSPF